MYRLLAAAALCLSLSTPALADGKIYVRLPNLSVYQGREGELFLERLILANVVSSNCAGYEVTSEEWSLLTDSADILAHQLGVATTATYEAEYEIPAFEALDRPGTCDEVGPSVPAIINELVRLGGSREALPDQEKAYRDDLARRTAWAAEAASRR